MSEEKAPNEDNQAEEANNEESSSETTPSKESSGDTAAIPSDRDCVVVAEDSPPNRKILVHLLKKLDFEVIEGSDGQAALDAMEAHPEANVVAILSDIMMPNMNGIELLKTVRSHEKYKDLPFVLITAVADKDYIIEAKAHNVNGYVLKPVTFDRVKGKLQELFPQKKFPAVGKS